MSPEKLKSLTRKELASMAKLRRVDGWHAMKKAELVKALVALTGTKASPENGRNGSAQLTTTGRREVSQAAAGTTNPRSKKRRASGQQSATALPAQNRRLGPANGHAWPQVDRLTVNARNPYWLEVHWELTQATLARAEAALGAQWHQATPILRVFDVTENETSPSSKMWVQDVEVRPDVDTWYLQVSGLPRAYKVHIGYLTPRGRFFTLTRSKKMTMSKSGAVARANGLSRNRVVDSGQGFPAAATRGTAGQLPNIPADHHYRAQAGGASPVADRNGMADNFPFHLDAELTIHGSTHPESKVTLMGNPVPLQRDGTFSLRLDLSDGRQVIPAVMLTPDGAEQRTIVLAVERNTKTLEPQSMDDMLY